MGAAFPGRRFTTRLDELLADDSRSTRSCSPRRCRPTRRSPSACSRPASTASSRSRWRSPSPEAEAVVEAARAQRPHPDGRPPARVPPRRREAQGDRRLRRAGRRPLHLLEPPQPRQAARRRERALEPRGARRVGGAAAGGRGADRVLGGGRVLHARGRRGRRLLLPALPLRPRGAPAPVLARPAQGAPLHGGRLEADGHVRRHGARAQAHRLRQGLRRGLHLLRRVHRPLRRRVQPEGAQRRAAADRVRPLRRLRARGQRRRARTASGLRVVRVLEELQRSLDGSRRAQAV